MVSWGLLMMGQRCDDVGTMCGQHFIVVDCVVYDITIDSKWTCDRVLMKKRIQWGKIIIY